MAREKVHVNIDLFSRLGSEARPRGARQAPSWPQLQSMELVLVLIDQTCGAFKLRTAPKGD